MSRPQLDFNVILPALLSKEQHLSDISILRNDIDSTLTQIGCAADNQVRGLGNCFSIRANTETDYNRYITQDIKLKDLFSGRGPLARAASQQAAIDYILDEDEKKYNKRKHRISSLFEYPLISEEDRVGNNLHDLLFSLSKYRDHSNVELLEFNELSWLEKEPGLYFYNKDKNNLRNVNQNHYTILKLKNELDIEFIVHGDSAITYNHPNEGRSENSTKTWFKGDYELIVKTLDEFFKSVGFDLLNYDFKQEFQTLIPQVEKIINLKNNDFEDGDYVIVDEQSDVLHEPVKSSTKLIFRIGQAEKIILTLNKGNGIDNIEWKELFLTIEHRSSGYLSIKKLPENKIEQQFLMRNIKKELLNMEKMIISKNESQ